MPRSTAWNTARGSRRRAWQKAGAAGQQRDVGQGGVAIENLDQEPVDDGRRGQQTARAPRVSGRAAGGVDEVVLKLGGNVLPESVESGRNPAMHRGASCAMVIGKNTMVHGGSDFLKTLGRLYLPVVLMPFGNNPLYRIPIEGRCQAASCMQANPMYRSVYNHQSRIRFL